MTFSLPRRTPLTDFDIFLKLKTSGGDIVKMLKKENNKEYLCWWHINIAIQQ